MKYLLRCVGCIVAFVLAFGVGVTAAHAGVVAGPIVTSIERTSPDEIHPHESVSFQLGITYPRQLTSVNVNINGPGGFLYGVSDRAVKQVSGNTHVAVPTVVTDRTWPAGTYTVSGVSVAAVDFNGHGTTDGLDIEPLTFTVAYPIDTSGPSLIGSELSETSFNLAHGAARLDATVTLSDPSGVSVPTVSLFHEATGQTAAASTMYQFRYDDLDAKFAHSLIIPTSTPPGRWEVRLDPTRDLLGNVGASYESLGFITLSNTTADLTGPWFGGSTFSGAAVNLADGPATIPVDVKLTDPSGTRTPSITLEHYETGQRRALGPMTLVWGTVMDGTWELDFTTPADVATGRWRVWLDDTRDLVGNGGDGSRLLGEVLIVAGPTVPSAPRSVTAVARNGQAFVWWDAPELDGWSPITSYTVTVNQGGAAVVTTDLSVIIRGLTNGTTYSFTVHANNSIGTSPPAGSFGVTPTRGPAIERQAGADRFQTSAAISARTFSLRVPVAYIANGVGFPDALSGAAAAGALGGPVFLTQRGALPEAIHAELDRLNPQRIVLLGGTAVVSDTVRDQAASYGTQVVRLAGADRFATSAAISEATFTPGVPVAYIANGMNFPDALSGAAAAGALGGPVLLTRPDALPVAIRAELDRLNPQKIILLGGAAVVSDNVRDQAGIYTGQVTRSAGSDRFATSAAISAASFSPGVPVAYIANGMNFPDALSGAATAGVLGGPVLLTQRDALPGTVRAELDRLNPQKIIILGGTAVVSENVRHQAATYIAP